MSNVLLVAEHAEGKIKDATFELLSLAREIAAAGGGSVVTALLGYQMSELAARLARRAGTVACADHELLAHYTSDGYAPVVAQIARDQKAALVLLTHSSLGWDLAPRLAALLDAGLVTECVSVTAGSAGLIYTRRIFNGKLDADLSLRNCAVQVATVRPGARPAAEGETSGSVIQVAVGLRPEQVRIRFVERRRPPKGKVDLSQSEIIVSGGRGLGGADKFKILEELAAALGGELGASRPVVDAGWLSHERQVGSSGVTVTPKLYIACGISGAMHHLAGMKGSKFIIAINKDAEAPIFEVADVGVVGDLFEVVPALTQAIQTAKGG